MRRFVVVAAAIITVAQGAQAADMPDFGPLRGALSSGMSSQRVSWQGFYVGGQWGYAVTDQDYHKSTEPMLKTLLDRTIIENEMQVSQWPLDWSNASNRGSNYGGFVGYNWQWDEVVVGLEANYTHGTFGGAASGSPSGNPTGRSAVLADTLMHAVTVDAKSSMVLHDVGSLRLRGGYQVGSWLPYAFGGLAVGAANGSQSVKVTDSTWSWTAPLPGTYLGTATLSRATNYTNRIVYGYSAGLGIDVMLFQGLFVRAEWEYTNFTTAVDTYINTVRLGAGYKF